MPKSVPENQTKYPCHSIIPFLFSLLFLAGCGGKADLHPSVGFSEGSDQVKTLAIPLFVNATFEPILEKELTRIFKETFFAQGWHVKNSQAGNHLTLSAKITRFSRRPTSLTLTGGAREYQIKIAIDVELLKGTQQEKTFSRTVEGIADYVARSDAATDRISKDRAIREAGRKMAEEVSLLLQLSENKQPHVATE